MRPTAIAEVADARLGCRLDGGKPEPGNARDAESGRGRVPEHDTLANGAVTRTHGDRVVVERRRWSQDEIGREHDARGGPSTCLHLHHREGGTLDGAGQHIVE